MFLHYRIGLLCWSSCLDPCLILLNDNNLRHVDPLLCSVGVKYPHMSGQRAHRAMARKGSDLVHPSPWARSQPFYIHQIQLTMGIETLYSWGLVILIWPSTKSSGTSSRCVLQHLLRLHSLFLTSLAALSRS